MDPDPDPRKEIKVDPDPERGLKWIRIRPNAVDPGGSGSETLIISLREHQVLKVKRVTFVKDHPKF